jgi:hypothetical protein
MVLGGREEEMIRRKKTGVWVGWAGWRVEIKDPRLTANCR